jgi:Wzt C-terminal domain
VMLGLKRREIRDLVPSIVAFAELEPFIHMPVRHYSSGMFLRLAFAISVHVDPDILLIDEAFSVGDIYFRAKCLDKMRTFQEEGRTFLVVSHDIEFIQQICDEVIWIDKGRIVAQGLPTEVVDQYKRTAFQRSAPVPLVHHSQTATASTGRFGRGVVTVDYIDFLDETGKACPRLENGKPLTIRATYHLHDREQMRRDTNGTMALDCTILIQSQRGHGVVCIATEELDQSVRLTADHGEILFHIDRLDLTPGLYVMGATFYGGSRQSLNAVYDLHSRMYTFAVAERDGLSPIAGLDPPCRWEC